MGTTNIHDESVSSFDHGSLASIGATALQLKATSIPCRQGVEVSASAANGAGILYVGNSDVTAGSAAAGTDGFALAAGARVFVPIDDVNKVYLIGSTTGLVASYICY